MYHNHVNLNCFYDSNDNRKHSPLIGFLFDSYPIYGPFGYSNANVSTSSIKRMKSSYSLRSIKNRTNLADGKKLTSNLYGPPVIFY